MFVNPHRNQFFRYSNGVENGARRRRTVANHTGSVKSQQGGAAVFRVIHLLFETSKGRNHCKGSQLSDDAPLHFILQVGHDKFRKALAKL